jgi:hypothetical protein
MFSIQKFFSHDGKFFDLLEASADETRESTRLLIDLLKDRSHPHPLEEFALSRGKDKRIVSDEGKTENALVEVASRLRVSGGQKVGPVVF